MPPEVVMEIEDLEAEIETLQAFSGFGAEEQQPEAAQPALTPAANGWEYCQIQSMVRAATPQIKRDLEESGFEGTFIEQEDIILVYLAYVRYFSVTGQPPREVIPEVATTIARLGLEGWEMVSHTQLNQPAAMESFLFKRPI